MEPIGRGTLILICIAILVFWSIVVSQQTTPTTRYEPHLAINNDSHDDLRISGWDPSYPSYIKKDVLKQLHNPDSAVFGDLYVRKFRYRNSNMTVPCFCGEVNARHGSSGYTGMRAFIDILRMVEIDPGINNDKFVKHWNKFCADKIP